MKTGGMWRQLRASGARFDPLRQRIDHSRAISQSVNSLIVEAVESMLKAIFVERFERDELMCRRETEL